MTTNLTSKGQVTVPKPIRDALGLTKGKGVEFKVNAAGEVVIARAGAVKPVKADRFEAARGKAQIKWRTDDLMKLLRG